MYKIVAIANDGIKLEKTNPADFKTLTLSLPNGQMAEFSIYLPIESGINPNYQEARVHTQRWALDHGLFKKEDTLFKKFCIADFTKLTAYVYREEGLKELTLVSDFISWLFVHDDLRDGKDTIIGKSTDEVKEMNAIFETILATGEIKYTGLEEKFPIIKNLATSLKSIVDRISSLREDVNPTIFNESMQDYFAGNLWEAQNREQEMTPSFSNYMEWRKSTSAVTPCLELGMLTRNIQIPAKIRKKDLAFKHTVINISKHICFVNDVFSLNKELRDDVVENMVYILKEENSIPYSEAINKSIKIIDAEFLSMEKLFNGPYIGNNPNVTQFSKLLYTWAEGNTRWSQETGLYTKK